MVITRIWFSGPKSRSVNIFFQRPDCRIKLSCVFAQPRASNLDSQSVWFGPIEMCFLLFLGTRLIFEVPDPAARENCGLDSRPKNRIPVMAISTIPMHQDRPISFLQSADLSLSQDSG